MIIQIRGTSGSGKSTAMRKVMSLIGGWNAVTSPSRKRPLYYRSAVESGWPTTLVMGGYLSACGGCDGIGSAAEVYAATLRAVEAEQPEVVLMEGLLLAEDVKWTVQLPAVRCLFLVTPMETCAEWIARRRAEAGNDKSVDAGKKLGKDGRPKPTAREKLTARAGTINRARLRLVAAGVRCNRVTADQAPGVVLNWIRLHANPGG